PSHKGHRVDHLRGRNAIALPDETIVHLDHIHREPAAVSQPMKGRVGQAVDKLALSLLGTADADPQHLDVRTEQLEPHEQTGLGTCTPGAVYDGGDAVLVLRDLRCAIDVAESPDRVRAADRNDIRSPTP